MHYIFSSSYTRSLYLMSVNGTLFYTIIMFANDMELYNSTPRSTTDSLRFCSMQNCVSDVKRWTIHNRLQLNEDRTEALPCDPSKSSDLPDVLNTDQSHIPFCNRRSSEIQGTALGKCLQAWPVHIGPGLRV